MAHWADLQQPRGRPVDFKGSSPGLWLATCPANPPLTPTSASLHSVRGHSWRILELGHIGGAGSPVDSVLPAEVSSQPGLKLAVLKLVPLYAIVVSDCHSLLVPASSCSFLPGPSVGISPVTLSCLAQGAFAVSTVLAGIRGLETEQPAKHH